MNSLAVLIVLTFYSANQQEERVLSTDYVWGAVLGTLYILSHLILSPLSFLLLDKIPEMRLKGERVCSGSPIILVVRSGGEATWEELEAVAHIA